MDLFDSTGKNTAGKEFDGLCGKTQIPVFLF